MDTGGFEGDQNMLMGLRFRLNYWTDLNTNQNLIRYQSDGQYESESGLTEI